MCTAPAARTRTSKRRVTQPSSAAQTPPTCLFSARWLEPNLGYPLPEALTVAELCQAGSGYVVDGKLVKFVKVRAQAVRPPFLAAAPLHAPPRLLILAGPASVVHRDVSRAAAAVGDLHLFKMLRCLTDDAYLMPWDEGTARAAARAGHHELLKLARGVGCPWEEEHMDARVRCRERVGRDGYVAV